MGGQRISLPTLGFPAWRGAPCLPAPLWRLMNRLCETEYRQAETRAPVTRLTLMVLVFFSICARS